MHILQSYFILVRSEIVELVSSVDLNVIENNLFVLLLQIMSCLSTDICPKLSRHAVKIKTVY